MSSENPKISVIMPAYNAARFVKSTLDTLVGQTYRDWEVIIIDGGSTDNTLALIEEYAKTDPRFRVVREKCQSPYEAIFSASRMVTLRTNGMRNAWR